MFLTSKICMTLDFLRFLPSGRASTLIFNTDFHKNQPVFHICQGITRSLSKFPHFHVTSYAPAAEKLRGSSSPPGCRFHRRPCPAHLNTEIVPAKFPHHLTAHPAWREDAEISILAHHRNGGKFPFSIVDGLEKCIAFGADGGV